MWLPGFYFMQQNDTAFLVSSKQLMVLALGSRRLIVIQLFTRQYILAVEIVFSQLEDHR